MDDIPKFDPRWDKNTDWKAKSLKEKQIATNTPEWRRFRRNFLKQHPYCQLCSVKFATQVHHIIPRAERPDLMYAPDNCKAVCKECHYLEHGYYQGYYSKGKGR